VVCLAVSIVSAFAIVLPFLRMSALGRKPPFKPKDRRDLTGLLNLNRCA